MASYTTLDYVPDLTTSEMSGARSLPFSISSFNSSGWDYTASVFGNNSFALLHQTYRFNAVAGATYDIFSTSYFDPYLLRIYDGLGNTIVANDESDDGPDVYLGDAYYRQDVIFNWVAPYSGTYFVAASWNQGNFFKFYSLSIYEDVDTVAPVLTPDYALTSSAAAVNEGASVTYTLITTNVAAGTVLNYTLSGISTADLFGIPLMGTVSVGFGGVTSVTFGIASDNLTEGLETMVLSLSNMGGVNLVRANGVTINDTSLNAKGITYIGTSGNDTVVGSIDNDFLNGGLGNDIFRPGAGNDTIDGGAGIDTVIFTGNRVNYGIFPQLLGHSVNGPDGLDIMTNVERLKFSDFSVALDVSGNAGTTAKILGAVFGKAAVANKEYAGIGLQLLDGGMSYLSLMQAAINAKLGVGASNAAVVDLLYKNVVGSPPPSSELALYKGLLDTGAFTQASLGVLAADTVANTININLVGLATSGLEYLPQG